MVLHVRSAKAKLLGMLGFSVLVMCSIFSHTVTLRCPTPSLPVPVDVLQAGHLVSNKSSRRRPPINAARVKLLTLLGLLLLQGSTQGAGLPSLSQA